MTGRELGTMTNAMTDALEELEQAISDGYALGHSDPANSAHALTWQVDGDTFALVYVARGDGGARIALEQSDDLPDAYWLQGKRVRRVDVVRFIASIC